MIFVDGKQQKHDESTKDHATNIRITSITRHKKCFSTSNTKVKARTTLPWSQEAIRAAWRLLGWNPRIRGGGAPRVVCETWWRSFFTNIIGYIFIVRRLGKQSKLMCPYRTLSLTQSELNLMKSKCSWDMSWIALVWASKNLSDQCVCIHSLIDHVHAQVTWP